MSLSYANRHPDSLPAVFLAGTERFSYPLGETEQKKFGGMAALQRHHVLAFAVGWRPRVFEQGAHFILLPNLPVHRLRQAMFLLASFIVAFYLAAFRRVRIIISQGVYDALPLVVAGRLLQLVGRRVCVVVQVHGDWEEAASLLGKVPRAFTPIARGISVFVLRRAGVVRVISEFTMAKARPFIPDGKPYLIFPGFTDIDLFLEDYVQRPTPRRPRFVYAGALTRLKGVHVLIDALTRLRDRGITADLIIAGEGDQRGRLERQARELGVREQVAFPGFVDQSELRNHIRDSDALVLPTFSEGFGRVLIEAMACRRPVVASHTGGIPELVRHGENGLLAEPGNPDDLAEQLQYLVTHPDGAQQMGMAGWRFVRDTYSRAAYFAHYRRLLETAGQTLAAASRARG